MASRKQWIIPEKKQMFILNKLKVLTIIYVCLLMNEA